MTNRWIRVGALVAALSGCGDVQPAQQVADFEVGGSDDPIVRAQQQALGQATDTVTLTVKNSTNYNFTQGLVLFSVPFVVNGAASAPFTSFVLGTSTKKGDATALATGLGLTLNTTAFVVPAILKGATATVTIQAPVGAKVTYVARVDTSVDDFVSVVNMSLSGSAPGALTGVIQGYDLAGPTKVSLGNGTTGQSLGGTAFTVVNQSDCGAGSWTTAQNLLTEEFTAGAGSKVWPTGFGWDGEFNGDWHTDGVTVRVFNPNWGGADPSAPIPTVTGFWKGLDVCPGVGALLNVESKVSTALTDKTSDTTMVVYFFDRAGALVSPNVVTNWPIYDRNDRVTAIHDVVIPTGTRRVVIAPMMRLGSAEQGTVYYDRITADYEPSGTYTDTTLASDDFSKTSNGSYGRNQPKDWAEFGGDWYAMTSTAWATLGNPQWANGKTNVDTGLVRTYALSGFTSADSISAEVFAAATFTDPTSFVRLRLVFNGGTAVESQRQARGWGNLEVRRQPLPAGTTSVTVIVNAYLGPTETSSLYVDDFSLLRARKN